MPVSGGGVFKAEGRANAKALKQGTALVGLRTSSAKGMKRGSSRNRMRAVDHSGPRTPQRRVYSPVRQYLGARYS